VIVVATHREQCGLTDLEISAMLRETFHSYVAEFPILKKVLFVDSVTGYHVNTLVETILTFVSRIQEQNRPIPMKFEVLLSALISYRDLGGRDRHSHFRCDVAFCFIFGAQWQCDSGDSFSDSGFLIPLISFSRLERKTPGTPSLSSMSHGSPSC
jgi:hypothetical protein